MEEGVLNGQLLDLPVAYSLRDQRDELSLSDGGVVGCVEEAGGVGEGEIEGQLCEVVHVDGRDAVSPATIDAQWLFLLECLLEEREQDVLAHAIDESTINHTAGHCRIQAVYAQRQMLKLFDCTRKRRSLQVVILTPSLQATATTPVKG